MKTAHFCGELSPPVYSEKAIHRPSGDHSTFW